MTFTVQVGLNGTLTYIPSTLMIHAGDTVRWVFATSPHTVTSGTNCVADANPLLDSGLPAHLHDAGRVSVFLHYSRSLHPRHDREHHGAAVAVAVIPQRAPSGQVRSACDA
jgi:hypothetical protein